MAFYKKTPDQLFIDKVKELNPDLPFNLDTDVAIKKVGIGSAIAADISLKGKVSAGTMGKATFRMPMRLQFQTFFTSGDLAPKILKTFGGVTPTRRQIVEEINRMCGVNFTTDCYADPDTLISNVRTLQQIAITSDSNVQWIGSIPFFWIPTPKLGDVLPKRKLTIEETPDLAVKAFTRDFTAHLDTLNAHDVNVPLSSNSSTAVALVNAIATVTGLAVKVGPGTSPGDDKYDLTGFVLSKPLIQSVTDANFVYRKLFMLTPPASYGKETVPLYLHCTKRNVTTETMFEVPATDYGDLF